MTARAAEVVTIVGPTASGKSALSLDVAQHLGGEIINADSMQVYRGMDIGTGKLALTERRGIPHHMLDVWDINEPANVADYQRTARECIAQIRSRGAVPILVGGSGLYVRAVLDDLQFPGTDAELRAGLLAELESLGAQALHERLRHVDPNAASAILPSNGRRIVRALEVIALTGTFTATLPQPRDAIASVTIGLEPDRAELDRRVNARVDLMWDAGFVDEVNALRERGLDDSPTARQALGYAQILSALQAGTDPDQAKEPTKVATRKFARRQMSWFRRDRATHWIAPHEADLTVQIARLWEQSRAS